MATEPLKPEELAAIVAPQQRRTDPLNDRDVRANVQANDELTAVEKFLRRVAAQKKPIGGFLGGLGTFLAAAATVFPERWLTATAFLCGVAGGILVGGGSAGIRSDDYDKVKNELLKQRGLM
jgi:hypothetical protein